MEYAYLRYCVFVFLLFYSLLLWVYFVSIHILVARAYRSRSPYVALHTIGRHTGKQQNKNMSWHSHSVDVHALVLAHDISCWTCMQTVWCSFLAASGCRNDNTHTLGGRASNKVCVQRVFLILCCAWRFSTTTAGAGIIINSAGDTVVLIIIILPIIIRQATVSASVSHDH